MEPLVISTWHHGLASNEAAYKILKNNGNSLDAVEEGVVVAENDPEVLSVGYGGLPDNEGKVTLDAAIMDWKARIGSVIFLENIKNPVRVARLILENTEHTVLAGDGAFYFAVQNGFKSENLLTEYSLKRYHEWLNEGGMKSEEIHTKYFKLIDDINKDGFHDTIGMAAIDMDGNLSAACTTSGVAWKLRGRVGDSPMIGAGLYVDGSIGAAIATGRGEECIRACGSFLIVELMRMGLTPEDACRQACKRVHQLNLLSHKNRDHLFQVGFCAVNKNGEFGSYSVRKGFQYAVQNNKGNFLCDSNYLIDETYLIDDL
jgi:N4-(beta-N-acetylglucosaminyl)-L-asparaginase